MTEVIPEFHKRSGHHVNARFQIINAITQRIRSGGAADLATVSPLQWESLELMPPSVWRLPRSDSAFL
jgi:hypothetical protein